MLCAGVSWWLCARTLCAHGDMCPLGPLLAVRRVFFPPHDVMGCALYFLTPHDVMRGCALYFLIPHRSFEISNRPWLQGSCAHSLDLEPHTLARGPVRTCSAACSVTDPGLVSASRKKQKRAVETLKHMSRAECHHEMNRLRLLAESRGVFQNRSNFSEWDRFFSERGKFLKDSEPPPRDLEPPSQGS